jgi:hypothetical protein
MKLFIFLGLLVDPMLCLATDYNFQGPNAAQQVAFVTWLRTELGTPLKYVVNNEAGAKMHLLGRLQNDVQNLQAARFGGPGWNFVNAQDIPESSTVSFNNQNYVIRHTPLKEVDSEGSDKDKQEGSGGDKKGGFKDNKREPVKASSLR